MYFNVKTREFPRYQGDLELLGWVAGETLPADWVMYEVPEPPAVKDGQIAEPSEPTEQDGKWLLNWNVRDLTDEEIKQRAISKVRQKVTQGMMLTSAEAELLVG